MDIATTKLGLIQWLAQLVNTALLTQIVKIKESNADTNNDFYEDKELQEMLDQRLAEPTEDYCDARSSLEDIRMNSEL